ncbi:MAG: DegV family protein [Clostridiales bacterium]|nr:DegV family protein [Clostridiales bacterium]
MKIAISAESTIDLPQELLDKYNISTIPFGITFKDALTSDHFGIAEEIFEFVNETKVLPKTSAIPPEGYREYFEELKGKYDAVIHICISSLMSSSYNNARLVAETMENVWAIDSANLSTGIALVAIKASQMVKTKATPEEIVAEIESYKEKVRVSFVLDKLNYMYKGGRCSAVTLLGANILKIKPQIVVTSGRMGVGKKYRGNLNKVIENYANDVVAESANADKSIVFITHSSPMPECEKIIEERLKAAGFETIYNTFAGGTVSSHCGPNCIGILFADK